MKAVVSLALAAVGLVSVACGAGDQSPEAEGASETVASTEQALCNNQAGVGAVLASLAVATAYEMRRWNAPVDFQWNYTTDMLEVSPAGNARCYGSCRNVNALLSLQKDSAYHSMTFPGGILLDSYALRGAMKSYYDRQVRCNYWWGEYASNGCWVEAHDLWFWKKEPGMCAMDNYFAATKAGTSSTLDVPERLNYQLYFVGYPVNEFLNFRNYGSNVAIDPTLGLTELNSSTSGSCVAACSQYSSTSLVGRCCSCNGLTKTFQRSYFSYDMYLCK